MPNHEPDHSPGQPFSELRHSSNESVNPYSSDTDLSHDLVHTWQSASTGADGWWVTQHPDDHFRTSLFAADRIAEIIAAMISEFLPQQAPSVLDLGAGSGALTEALAARQPQWPVTAVDVRPGPTGTTGRWLVDTWDVQHTAWTTGAVEAWWADQAGPVVVIGHEFLDELPCPVGPNADPAWAARWWPDAAHPHLPEVGRTRDRAWADVLGRLGRTGGLAVMVDYGHRAGQRPTGPTLRGFRDGHLVEPALDGSVNLTADVAVDAVAAAAEDAGGRRVWFARQSDTVEHWLPQPTGSTPLADLVARNHRRVLGARESAGGRGLGDYWWLVHRVAGAGGATTPDMAG